MSAYEKKKILITVKTYPLPSKKTIEASCTAGITEDGKWIRLFPLPFRHLESSKQFKKYQWIEASVTKAKDPRPESYKIDIDSISLLGKPMPTYNNWLYRKEIILPLESRSLCDLQNTQGETDITLSIFKPRCINELIIEPEEVPHWTEDELATLNQQSMFDKKYVVPLEKIPFKFKYRFLCGDSNCSGHILSVTDWEVGQAYRKFRKLYRQGWEYQFRKKFGYDMIYNFDTHFYVGTTRAHKHTWIIIGIFYPHKEVA
ncbi:MAG TPA: hypothetical protein G4O09_05375 [Dehalococcoidia bacterium]|nr:hypothetical protein [Dehalococcoidia bacterium]